MVWGTSEAAYPRSESAWVNSIEAVNAFRGLILGLTKRSRATSTFAGSQAGRYLSPQDAYSAVLVAITDEIAIRRMTKPVLGPR
jgi:hypothetical protein